MGVVSDASWTGTSNTVDNWWQSPDEHYPLFTGMVESWEVGFEGPNMSWVDIRASDGIAQLSQIQLETWIATSGPNSNTNPPTFAAEPSGTRISNLFACKDILTSNYPFWHSGADRAPSDSTYFDLDTGLTTVQGKEVTGNLWSEIQALAATEASPFVGVSRSGKFTFQARYEGDNNAYLEFDNRAANVPPNGSRTPIYQIRFGVNWDEVGNTAKVYRDDPYNYLGGLPAEYSDSSSVGTYGMKPVVLQNTQFTVGQEIGSGDWDAKSLAVMLVHHWSTPQMIPFQVIVKPLAVEGLTNDTTVWTNVLGNMEVGNQAVVYFDHPGLNAVETSSEMIVNGIAHSISQGGREWTTTFTLGYGGTYVDVSDFHVIGTNDFNDGKYAAY